MLVNYTPLFCNSTLEIESVIENYGVLIRTESYSLVLGHFGKNSI